MKIHKAKIIYGNGYTVTTTLCGRSSKESEDGTNSNDDDSQVTCKFCLNIMKGQSR